MSDLRIPSECKEHTEEWFKYYRLHPSIKPARLIHSLDTLNSLLCKEDSEQLQSSKAYVGKALACLFDGTELS